MTEAVRILCAKCGHPAKHHARGVCPPAEHRRAALCRGPVFLTPFQQRMLDQLAGDFLRGESADPKSLANKLGAALHDVRAALDHLECVGYVERRRDPS